MIQYDKDSKKRLEGRKKRKEGKKTYQRKGGGKEGRKTNIRGESVWIR